MQAQYITAKEVSEVLGVSVGKAYKIIHSLNEELKANGYITVSGKCSMKYFQQKVYGFEVKH